MAVQLRDAPRYAREARPVLQALHDIDRDIRSSLQNDLASRQACEGSGCTGKGVTHVALSDGANTLDAAHLQPQQVRHALRHDRQTIVSKEREFSWHGSGIFVR